MTSILGEEPPWEFLQTRYIAPFVILLFAGVFSSVRLPDTQQSKRLILGLTIAVLFTIGIQFSSQSAKDLRTILRKSEHIQWQIANRLSQLGIKPGEKVAILGQEDYYWARLSKVKIVASIPDVEEFWTANAVTRAEVLKAITKTGARAVVQRPGFMNIPDISTRGWQEISNTHCYVYLLQMNSTENSK
jgi:hypothetical protein